MFPKTYYLFSFYIFLLRIRTLGYIENFEKLTLSLRCNFLSALSAAFTASRSAASVITSLISE